MTTPTPSVDRPNPLRTIAASVGTAWAAVSAVLGAAVSFGVLTAAQAEALNATGVALPGFVLAIGTIAGALFPLLGGVAAAFGTAKSGRDVVTPVSDPVDNQGRRLTPDVVPVDSAAETRAALGDRGEGYARP